MYRKVFKEGWVIILCSFITGCNNQQHIIVEKDTVLAVNVSEAILPFTKDSSQKRGDNAAHTIAREITAADEQYLSLTIPDYSEIVFHYENSKETADYVNALKQYFIARKCSINGNDIIENTTQEVKSRRFYIQHVGDNRFVITVYNEYGNEHHP